MADSDITPTRFLGRQAIDELAWVRVTVLNAANTTVAEWDVQDCWYRLGGHQPPQHQQQAREDLAAAEVREWLRANQPPHGLYVVWVAALDRHTDTVGTTWATVRVEHHTSRPQALP